MELPETFRQFTGRKQTQGIGISSAQRVKLFLHCAIRVGSDYFVVVLHSDHITLTKTVLGQTTGVLCVFFVVSVSFVMFLLQLFFPLRAQTGDTGTRSGRL